MDDRTDQQITNDLLQAILDELKSQLEYAYLRDVALYKDNISLIPSLLSTNYAKRMTELMVEKEHNEHQS